ncbi:HEXXH motif domain-containing protein [Moraxella catarrhalis]|uniref:aKG-HExxH-type peptide beta-hydroxylase n=4 Tax=Moraxella catarrhalis TaxID=480 RepID=UPI0009C25945|nr:HEXXH motif-containing putative peptide modification protein [Moraxella catarrhalis]ARE66278.1 HEXXH motif domain-containing protein [Moraxella catarrhalis]MPX44509.1 HEXXH motif domain-containing protein [Moraxella catarrhalis]RKM05348.1 HEXXH motif domain-containing protein [Moraxella catarrhalis]RKM06943.1 HEXXH motif domain-containing protein [Moraxella catarrhalis]RKM11828.1 HEXXH motif domain-containing protein [Moraxella catarrhalis]
MNFNDIYNPNQSLAIVLRGANNKKIVDSFYYLLDVCDEILDKDFKKNIAKNIEFAESHSILEGILFHFINHLVKSITKNNIYEINDVFISFNKFISFYDREKIIFSGVGDVGNLYLNQFNKINDDAYEFSCKPINVNLIDEYKLKINNLMNFIKDIDFETYMEIDNIVDDIYVFGVDFKDSQEMVYSGSDFDKLGCIFFNEEIFVDKDDLFVLDKIIHESAHQILLSVMIHDEVVLNSDDERYPSPLRTGLRTMNGIYHAAFVLYRIARFFNQIIKKQNTQYSYDDLISHINKNKEQFLACYDVISKNGKLTNLGSAIIENCYKELKDMPNEINR